MMAKLEMTISIRAKWYLRALMAFAVGTANFVVWLVNNGYGFDKKITNGD